MARFNTATKEKKTVLNHEGAKAYSLSAELELYSLVVTSLFSDKFYESTDDRVSRLRALLTQVEPKFIAQLAIYAREQMYLRTIPLVLVVELAKIHNGDSLVSNTLGRVIKRADEITETLAYYSLANEREGVKKLGKLSKQIQKGLALAFNSFDEYQFAKYNRDADIKLRDALFIVHPTAKDAEQQALFTSIVNDTLSTPLTWETEASAKGNTADVWTGLIDSKKLPYMAALRNIRNMLNVSVDQPHLAKVAQLLSSEEQVKKSKQLPFRYLSAFREISDNDSAHTSMMLNALEEAIQVSAQNIKGFDFNTTVAIACDVSGSMQTPVSPKSKVQNYDIGLLLGMLLQSRCKSVVSGMFGDSYLTINLPQKSILQNVQELHRKEGIVGYSTNGHLVLSGLQAEGVKADKVMIFTDCQMWDSYHQGGAMSKAWTKYKKFHPAAKLYLFDLAGYGNTPVDTHLKDVYLIAGWSDKIFDVLEAFDQGESAVSHIKQISI